MAETWWTEDDERLYHREADGSVVSFRVYHPDDLNLASYLRPIEARALLADRLAEAAVAVKHLRIPHEKTVVVLECLICGGSWPESEAVANRHNEGCVVREYDALREEQQA